VDVQIVSRMTRRRDWKLKRAVCESTYQSGFPDMMPGWRCTIVDVAVERLADGGMLDGCGECCR
jgi:hypothetical protein